MGGSSVELYPRVGCFAACSKNAHMDGLVLTDDVKHFENGPHDLFDELGRTGDGMAAWSLTD